MNGTQNDNHNLLTFANAKTSKGEKLGYLTAILYLSPADLSGLGNVCASASEGCKSVCLNTAGRGRFMEVQNGRLRKTELYFNQYDAFMAGIKFDILKAVRKAEREGLELAVRLNGTSDLPKIATHFADMFPEIRFYDYTKHKKAYTRVRANYDLTFSLSESNEVDAIDALNNGINVAAVFGVTKNEALPETWNGFKVINGDEHDLRFLDTKGDKGVVVGLYAKGEAIYDLSGFVQHTPETFERATKKAVEKAKRTAKLKAAAALVLA